MDYRGVAMKKAVVKEDQILIKTKLKLKMNIAMSCSWNIKREKVQGEC